MFWSKTLTLGAVACVFLLSACSGQEVTAERAKAVASAEYARALSRAPEPSPDLIESSTVRDMQTKWRVECCGGTGGYVIDVEKRTGKATIVDAEQ
jgi:hypothetical protein